MTREENKIIARMIELGRMIDKNIKDLKKLRVEKDSLIHRYPHLHELDVLCDFKESKRKRQKAKKKV